MANTIIFKIEISKESGGFAHASNFITKLCNGEAIDLVEVVGISSKVYKNYKFDYKAVANYVIEQKNEFREIVKPELLSMSSDYQRLFCLWVEESGINDIIDLQYDVLIKKYFKNNDIFTILFGTSSFYFKASHYMYSLSIENSDLYNRIFYVEKERIIRLQKQNVNLFNDFMPLEYFSEEEKKLFHNLGDYISRECVLKILSSKEVVDLESITPNLRVGLKVLEFGRNSFSSEETNRICDLLFGGNVFEFLLFVYSCSNKAFWKEKSGNDIERHYLKIKECAIGCEQLIENAISHSETKAGVVSIRIHEAKSEYLQKRYQLIDNGQRWVEVLITDYAGINYSGNIADNFKRNLEKAEKEIELQPIDLLVEPSADDKEGVERKQIIDNYILRSDNIGKHIGLKIFKKIVEESNGLFAFYSHRSHLKQLGENYTYTEYSNECFPGTGYTVLFPLKKANDSTTRAEVAIDENIYLEKNIKEFISGYNCETFNVDHLSFSYNNQSEKEKLITEIAELLSRERMCEQKRNIVYISAENLETNTAEYLAKGLMVASNSSKIADYVFYNCTKDFASFFRQTMYIYLGMRELEYLYKDKEFVIALYTKKPIESYFLIPGNSRRTIWANQVNCYSGIDWIQNKWIPKYADLRFLSKLTMENIPPYDIIYQIDNKTIFEKYTLQILETDIQEKSFGCKMTNTHMRLGSTIHIDSFYEAELLFSNRLFSNRFSYLLVKKIVESESFREADEITLYSYALYSEPLIVETVDLLSALFANKQIDYAILEREADHRDFSHIDRIRYGKTFESDKERKKYFENRKIICIVPINSTLKTHEKLLSLFIENNGEKCAANVILNYALILVGSKGKNKYWEINENNKTFDKINLNISPLPEYFIDVQVDYYEAIDCELCFPPNPLDEIPLVEVNAASTIPNQSFGLYGDRKKLECTFEWIKEQEKELSELKKSLIYRHICRGENHFLYYFKTDELFIQHKSNIVSWLKKIANLINIQQDELHVLFCPAHYSNAGFAESVNRVVFHEAALIIRVDVDKEYRSNICAKYSNLSEFIRLLENEGKEANTVKIYYVDDCIISGRTFYRAKSLVSSVVERYRGANKNLKVHIFEKIFVLLDRNSMQNRLQYIGCWDSANKEIGQLKTNFFAYKTLHISSMRNHGDSCILCQLEREAEKLYKESATKQMERYWEEQKKKFEVHFLKDKKQENETSASNKNYRRMFCYHIASQVVAGAVQGNSRENVIESLLNLLITDYYGRKEEYGQDNAFEYFLSYLKIISRPFLIFDKSVKEAVFDVQLILAEELLYHKAIGDVLSGLQRKKYLLKFEKEFNKLINQIVWKDFSTKQKTDLLKLLLKQLTEMKSNYFIRMDNIKKLVAFAENIEETERTELYNRFLQQTKKLLGVSSDTSKSAWFSKCLYGKEMELGLPENVLGRMLVENTRAFYDGLEKIYRSKKREEGFALEEELKKAQYRDFVSILSDMKLVSNAKISSEGEKEILAALELLEICKEINLKQKSSSINIGIEKQCLQIAKAMKRILNAYDVKIVLGCPLECDQWEDDLRIDYNTLVNKYTDDKISLPLKETKEFLVIADSNEERQFIVDADIKLINHFNAYYSQISKHQIEGLFVNIEEQYIIWEIRDDGSQLGQNRRLLVYASFENLRLPEGWHSIRNLLCMNRWLNDSVFNNNVIDYLFELILADKKGMLYDFEKAHSHTIATVRNAQCSLARDNAQDKAAYHMFVIMLLSDLQISQVYRNSLKKDYYRRRVGIYLRAYKSVFSFFEDGKEFPVLNQQETNKYNYLIVKRKEKELQADEEYLQDDDLLLSYSEANGENEVFLLLFALIMNATGINRGVREKVEEEKNIIKVYLTKTKNGELRIANQCVDMTQDIKVINAELCRPPHPNKGISLWGVSRFIKSIISVLLSKKLRDIEKQIMQTINEEDRLNMLNQMKGLIEKMTSEAYNVRVGTYQKDEGEYFFYMDVPILAKKYSDFDTYF